MMITYKEYEDGDDDDDDDQDQDDDDMIVTLRAGVFAFNSYLLRVLMVPLAYILFSNDDDDDDDNGDHDEHEDDG